MVSKVQIPIIVLVQYFDLGVARCFGNQRLTLEQVIGYTKQQCTLDSQPLANLINYIPSHARAGEQACFDTVFLCPNNDLTIYLDTFTNFSTMAHQDLVT